jgi:hypothetical protein
MKEEGSCMARQGYLVDVGRLGGAVVELALETVNA